MKPRTLLTTAALFAVALFILDVPAAKADDYQSKAVGPADWADYQSWQIYDTGTEPPAWRDAVSGEVPDDDDFATIRATHTIDVASEDADQEADHIEVEAGGILNIEQSRTLTLDGWDSITSTVNGTINLLYSDPNYGTLAFITNNHILTRTNETGKIVGVSVACMITISAGETLTSQITVEGCLTITGAGSFTNSGIVEANCSGTLKLAVTGTLDDGTNDDRWKVSANGAKLQFDSTLGTVSTLDGNFVMTTGDSTSEIIFDHALTTNGRLQISSGVTGVVKCNEDVTFDADYATTANPLDMQGGKVEVAAQKTCTHY